MNKVILMGRATADPEVRFVGANSDLAVATITLAVDRRVKRDAANEQTADFIRCKAFGKNAEFFQNYVKKGTKLLISGRIQTGSYTNKDGQKVYTTDVVIDEQEFAESKRASENSASSAPSSPSNMSVPKRGNDASFVSVEDGDDDLPFN